MERAVTSPARAAGRLSAIFQARAHPRCDQEASRGSILYRDRRSTRSRVRPAAPSPPVDPRDLRGGVPAPRGGAGALPRQRHDRPDSERDALRVGPDPDRLGVLAPSRHPGGPPAGDVRGGGGGDGAGFLRPLLHRGTPRPPRRGRLLAGPRGRPLPPRDGPAGAPHGHGGLGEGAAGGVGLRGAVGAGHALLPPARARARCPRPPPGTGGGDPRGDGRDSPRGRAGEAARRESQHAPPPLHRPGRAAEALRLGAPFPAGHAYPSTTPGATWADVVARFGYSDQAHLVRDYRRFSGAPPTRWDAGHRAVDRRMGIEEPPEEPGPADPPPPTAP
jgi:AraC-like DNA-binding protein